jgi:5'/3'-nucleotidase
VVQIHSPRLVNQAALQQQPIILVSNDDGIHAAGIRALCEALERIGDVWVVAPETERSATSHAITLDRPLRLREHGAQKYALDGTPVDCVYLGMYGLLKERRPDIVVAGINHGANLGSDAFYSGTVGAAREGALRGTPALAVSLAGGHGSGFAFAAELACEVVQAILARGTEAPRLLSMNIPEGQVRGIRVTTLGKRSYYDQVEVRTDPRGRAYYWIGGPGSRTEMIPGSDGEALAQGYAALTPLTLDLGLIAAEEQERSRALVTGLAEANR